MKEFIPPEEFFVVELRASYDSEESLDFIFLDQEEAMTFVNTCVSNGHHAGIYREGKKAV
jgi:hypothetical protein